MVGCFEIRTIVIGWREINVILWYRDLCDIQNISVLFSFNSKECLIAESFMSLGLLRLVFSSKLM